jgi:hypothetical protein
MQGVDSGLHLRTALAPVAKAHRLGLHPGQGRHDGRRVGRLGKADRDADALVQAVADHLQLGQQAAPKIGVGRRQHKVQQAQALVGIGQLPAHAQGARGLDHLARHVHRGLAPLIEHPVDRGQAHAREPGHVLHGGFFHGCRCAWAASRMQRAR